jgi:hypothetical protein
MQEALEVADVTGVPTCYTTRSAASRSIAADRPAPNSKRGQLAAADRMFQNARDLQARLEQRRQDAQARDTPELARVRPRTVRAAHWRFAAACACSEPLLSDRSVCRALCSCVLTTSSQSCEGR